MTLYVVEPRAVKPDEATLEPAPATAESTKKRDVRVDFRCVALRPAAARDGQNRRVAKVYESGPHLRIQFHTEKCATAGARGARGPEGKRSGQGYAILASGADKGKHVGRES